MYTVLVPLYEGGTIVLVSNDYKKALDFFNANSDNGDRVSLHNHTIKKYPTSGIYDIDGMKQ